MGTGVEPVSLPLACWPRPSAKLVSMLGNYVLLNQIRLVMTITIAASVLRADELAQLNDVKVLMF